MKPFLAPFAIGCGLVLIVGVVVLIGGWGWPWFAIVNGVIAVLLLVLFRGATTGADERRPPGVARVSATRVAGLDPEKLSAAEAAYEPDPDAAAEARADDLAAGFAFLWTAAAPAVAAILAVVFG